MSERSIIESLPPSVRFVLGYIGLALASVLMFSLTKVAGQPAWGLIGLDAVMVVAVIALEIFSFGRAADNANAEDASSPTPMVDYAAYAVAALAAAFFVWAAASAATAADQLAFGGLALWMWLWLGARVGKRLLKPR